MLTPHTRRTLSFLMAFVMLFSMLPIRATATETETNDHEYTTEITAPVEAVTQNTSPVTDTVVSQLQAWVDDILNRYLGTTQLSTADVYVAVAKMNDDVYWEALEDVYDFQNSDAALQLTEEEIVIMTDCNPTFCDFSTALYERRGKDTSVSFFGTTVTVLDGQVAVTDTANSISESSGTVTVTAKGGSGLLSSPVTNTITISNQSGSTATLSFNYSASNYGSFSKGSDSGTIVETLAAGNSITMSISGKQAILNNTATLTLNNFDIELAKDTSNITFNIDSERGSITVNEAAVANNAVIEVASTGAALVATPEDGYTFVGWTDSSNVLLSGSSSYTLLPTSDMTVKAVFSKTNEEAMFLVDGVLYADLNSAITAAGDSKTIILAANGTLTEGTYTIPAGVKLLIPYDADGTLITDNMLANVSSNTTAPTTSNLYRQLTMASNANIIVRGVLCVGSQATRQMIGQVGPYGAIVMNDNSSIEVPSGGKLYVWGYIFRGTSDGGTVTIKNEGCVYENLSVMDYPGSASTTRSLYSSDKIFPLRAFTIRNVEVPMNYEYGATGYVFYCLYGSSAGTHGGNVVFIGNSSSAPFQIMDGATVTKSYSSGKQKIDLKGNCKLNSLNISISGLYTVQSSGTSGFPVPSGFELALSDGTLTLGDNVILTEGTKMTIAENAIVEAGDKNIYVFAETDDAGAVSAKDVHGTAYTQVKADAVFDINGTVNTSGGFYCSTNKASITSSGGTGIVKIASGSSATKVKIKTAKSTASEYDVTAAQLKNTDGTYTDTSSASNTTYTYCTHGVWSTETDKCEKCEIANCDHTYSDVTYTWNGTDCTATRSCTKACGLTETVNAAVASKEALAATCTAKGKTTYTATFDADWAKTQTQTLEDVAKDPANHSSTEFTYSDNGDGTHTVNHKCCGAVEGTVAHTYADHKCVCGAVEQFTITFNTNGGSDVAAITKGYGEEITKPANPTKTGYSFAGWDKNIPDTMPGENMTITASWTINQYTITFDTDGGSAVDPITQDYNTAVTAPADPTKEGYTFKGWSPEVPSVMPGNNLTVKAQWTPIEYTITFDSDGGTAVDDIKAGFETVITAPAAPTKTGYNFIGWDPELPATMPLNGLAVKAVWEVNQYTITFDTDGGSQIAAITQDYGSAVTAPADPTKTGYTFDSWDKEIPETMPAEDMTITAKWNVNSYTVTWIVDGVETVNTVSYGGKITAPADPSKAQVGCTTYTFAGWGAEIPATMPAENLTFTAEFTEGESHDWSADIDYKWELKDEVWTCTATRSCNRDAAHIQTATAIGSDPRVTTEGDCKTAEVTTWTATFAEEWAGTDTTEVSGATNPEVHASEEFIYVVHNDGTHTKKAKCCEAVVEEKVMHNYDNAEYKCECGDVKMFTITWVNGEDSSETHAKFGTTLIKPADPIKEGYTFAGWFTAETDGTKLADNATCDGTTTYYAQFTVNQYTITFNTDGGSAIASITQDYGTEVTAPADPTKTGYNFTGWDKEIPGTMPAENVTITAQWKINQYTITFVDTDGSELAKITQAYGTDVTAPETPTKTGYTFQNWDKTIPATMPAEDMTITAKWAIKTYTVKWMNGEGVFANENYEYGATITAPQSKPTKPADCCTAYIFTNWKGYEEGMTMPDDENLVFVAEYEETIKHTGNVVYTDNGETHSAAYDCCDAEYVTNEKHTYDEVTHKCVCGAVKEFTVTFTINGETYGEPVSVAFGAEITKPEYKIPAGYTFSDWTLPETMPAEDITLDATLSVNKYTIKFVNYDGTELASVEVEYGKLPEYTGETPTKAADEQSTYTFSGWTPELVAVTGEATYTAVFDAVAVVTEVAEVGGVKYKTLAEAIDAAPVNSTITLLANIEESTTVSKAVKIDKNGFTADLVAGPQYQLSYSNGVYTCVNPTLSSLSPSLSLDGEVFINFYFSGTGLEGIENLTDRMKLLVWKTDIGKDNCIYDENVDLILEGITYDSNTKKFKARSQGIAADYMGDNLWFKACVELENGSYVYSSRARFSPKRYAETVIPSSSYTQNLKDLCVALMNYGAAVQVATNYKADDLMNAFISDDAQSRMTPFSPDMITERLTLEKNVEFDTNNAFYNNSINANLTLDGAIAMNLTLPKVNSSTFTEAGALFWTEDMYAEISELSHANALIIPAKEIKGSSYSVSFEGIKSNTMDDTIFFAAYVKDGENYIYSSVARRSVEYLANKIITGSGYTDAWKEAMKAMVVYGEYAKINFG